jgi:hypothetical protein
MVLPDSTVELVQAAILRAQKSTRDGYGSSAAIAVRLATPMILSESDEVFRYYRAKIGGAWDSVPGHHIQNNLGCN